MCKFISTIAFLLIFISPAHAQWLRYELLPVESRFHLRTTNPIGWTDGATQRYQIGAKASLGPLHIRLAPQLVGYRSDRRGDITPNLSSSTQTRVYVQQELNRIDAPDRFSNSTRYRVLPGESFVRLESFGLALSASTEALKWGPGVRHGLILSGGHDGFPHVSFQTTRPLDIWVGNIEGMYMSGRLENSGIDPVVPTLAASAYRQKFDEWRYITGIVGSFEPRFMPGLKVGFSRSFVAYNTILKSTADYFPLFQPLTKDKFQDDDNPTGNDEWDQQLSMFFSWSFPSQGFRVYGELGRNDHSADVRDLIIQPEHSRAYVVGAEKKIDNWHTVVELTQLAMTKTQELRASPIWYTHHIVRHGITHRGQILGPEIGPGSNSWYASSTRSMQNQASIGMSLERVHRQEDLYRRLFPGNGSRRWSDITTEFHGSKAIGNVKLIGSVSLTKSFNYAFERGFDPVDGGVRLGVVWSIN